MVIRDFIRMLRKRWLWVLIPLVLAVLASGALVLSSAPLYQATSSVYFALQSATSANDLAQGSNYTVQQLDSYAELATLPVVLDPVIDQLQLKTDAQSLAPSITATPVPSTVIVTITVSDTSPSQASKISRTVATELGKQVQELAPRGSGKASAVNATVVAQATIPTVPASPKKARDVGAAALGGLFLGLLLAMARERLDNRVRDLKAVRGLSMVAMITADKRVRRAPLIVQGHDRSRRAEAFRRIRTNLQFVDVDAPIATIAVTSSVAGEGKSTTAANLAVVFAEAGLDVLLVEADLRRPKLSDLLGLERSVGLTNVLAGQAKIDDVLQHWGSGGVTVLPSGTIPPNPAELLGSRNMQSLLNMLRERFDMIVIDTPPLLPVTDGAVIAARVDGVLMITRYGKTTRGQLDGALSSLAAVDARVLGGILNMVPASDAKHDAAYDAYGYYSDADPIMPSSSSSQPTGQTADTVEPESVSTRGPDPTDSGAQSDAVGPGAPDHPHSGQADSAPAGKIPRASRSHSQA